MKIALMLGFLAVIATGTMANKCDIDVTQAPDTTSN